MRHVRRGPRGRASRGTRAPGAPIAVTARLGGLDLGRRTVDEVPVDLRFDVPGSAWNPGPNEFELAFDRTAVVWRTQHESGFVHQALGVERVHDAAPRPVAFVQVLDVHGPYLPGDGWRGAFVARTVGRSLLPSLERRLDHRGTVSGARLRAIYDENLAEFDAHLGAFVDGLVELGVYDDALIVLTADHGETMESERFTFAHAFPDERTLHVPLLVKLPGARRGGTRCGAPVQLVDLYPTLLAAAGLETTARVLHGRSLWPLLRGADDAILGERALVALDGAGRSRASVQGRYTLVEYPLRTLSAGALLSMEPAYARWAAFDPRTASAAAALGLEPDRVADLWLEHDDPIAQLPSLESLVLSLARFHASDPEPVRELFDLERDPLGLVDISDEHPDRVRRLARRLEASAAACEPLRGSQVERAGEPRPVADDLERLRALGYLGGQR